ncbi:nickel ABC transporter, nickel/metallophore periplasmic binding protein, partial [Salmonella enterica subsp. enterica]|nr:nickel ABC transporter, nickel/metallophore periplasmic binding protein [Salmonella enterica subsp. enterica serovar Abony]
ELALPRPFRFIAPSQFKDGGTKDGIIKPIGTGPWILTESRLSEKDEFARNELYWGKKPVYESVTFKVIPDPNTRAVAFEAGEVDLLYGTDGIIYPDTYQRFKNMPGYTTRLSAPLESLVLAINTKTGPTRDLAVRKAINHAVDKDKMIEKVLYGTQLKADTLFSENVPYADADLTPYAYNVEEAKSLLENAGWKAKTEN